MSTVAQSSIEELISKLNALAKSSRFVGNRAIADRMDEVAAHLLTETRQVDAHLAAAKQELAEARKNVGPASFGFKDGVYNICLGYHPESNEYEWLQVVALQDLAAAKQELEEVKRHLCNVAKEAGIPEHSTGSFPWNVANSVGLIVRGLRATTPPSPAAPHSPLTARGDGETPRTDIIKRKLIAEVRNFLHDKSDELDLSNALECTVDLIRPIELDLARLKEELERTKADTERLDWLEKHWHDWSKWIATDSDGWCQRFGEDAWLESTIRSAITAALKDRRGK